MNFFVYCKKYSEIGIIENFQVKIKEKTISLKECHPTIPFNISKTYKEIYLHCATLKKELNKKERIRVGFLRYKENYFFSLLLENKEIIMNPVFIKRELFNRTFRISVFCDGKRRESIYFNPDKYVFDAKRKLDFYPVLDKIFSMFNQFDAVFEKKLFVSFKRRS